jgi:ABC-type dipeptide/oligopeptide/nickel transport system permease component
MKKSRLLLTSNMSALIVIGIEIFLLIQSMIPTEDGLGDFLAMFMTLFMGVSLVFMIAGFILGMIAYFENNRWLTLASSIVYLIGTVIIFMFSFMVIPTLILSFTAYYTQVKQYQNSKADAVTLLP